ncbi:MAG: AAA family ATPase [Candidatus Pacearchaeota archaeon]|nr:AAA family ATPase [Candidatus Pacearchaeota archaeon]
MKKPNNLGYYLIIRGPLGCGKSTISKELAKELNAEYIAVDRVLDEHNLTNDWEDGYISKKSFLKVNEIVSERAKKLLNHSKPVIFDGNFYWKSCIDDLISRLNYSHYVFTLKAPVETCIKRDEERGKTHGEDAARAVYEKSTSFGYGIPIETKGKSVEETLSMIRKKLK